MSPDKTYTNTPPTELVRKVVKHVQIGWQYDRTGDEIRFLTDDEGQPIPRIVAIPNVLTHAEMTRVSIASAEWARRANLDPERLDSTDGADPDDMIDFELGTGLMFELAGSVLGENVLVEIGGDPTVDFTTMLSFVSDVCKDLGLLGSDVDIDPGSSGNESQDAQPQS